MTSEKLKHFNLLTEEMKDSLTDLNHNMTGIFFVQAWTPNL